MGVYGCSVFEVIDVMHELTQNTLLCELHSFDWSIDIYKIRGS